MKNLHHYLAECPGSVGELARAIDKTYLVSKPAISLAAAISLFSALKSGQVMTPEEVEPSLFVCLIAESGGGKSRANNIIEGLLEQHSLRSMIMGRPMSDSGLLKALARTPRSFLLWDEFGPALSELTQTATGHRSLILSVMMDLFSRAGKPFVGREYATQERVDIPAQWLTCFASSIPSRFYNSLSEDFVLDGFLSRWLTFILEEDIGEECATLTPPKFVCPPAVAEEIEKLANPIVEVKKGNLAVLSVSTIPKRVVPIQGLLHKAMLSSCFNELRAAPTEIRRVFLSRKFEIYSKLCLVLGEGREVDLDTGAYAHDLAHYLIMTQALACEQKLGAGPKVKLRNQILSLLSNQWVTAASISRALPRTSGREREEALSDLLSSESIECAKLRLNQSRKVSKVYRLVSPE